MQPSTFLLFLLVLSRLYPLRKSTTKYKNNAARITTHNLTTITTKSTSSFAESPLESFVDTFCLPSNTLLTSSIACKSLSRHQNVLKPVSQVEAPPPKLEVHYLNYCSPPNPICDKMMEEIRSWAPKSLNEIHEWLYTSPVYSFPNGPNKPTRPRPLFSPKYPNTHHIIFHIGPDNYIDNQDDDVLAYTSFKNLESYNVADIYFSPITHEMVHCLQNGIVNLSIGYQILKKFGMMCYATAPRGLMEGIADFVPLMADEPMPEYGPRPSRSSERADKWDAGYMATAYFLEWIERVAVGPGAIGLLNARMGKVGYHREGEEKSVACGGQPDIWKAIYGRSVDELWDAYGRYLDGDSDLISVDLLTGTTGSHWDERSIALLGSIIFVTIAPAVEFLHYFNAI